MSDGQSPEFDIKNVSHTAVEIKEDPMSPFKKIKETFSHYFRNTFALTLGSSEILTQDPNLPIKARDPAKSIFQEGENILFILDAISHVSTTNPLVELDGKVFFNLNPQLLRQLSVDDHPLVATDAPKPPILPDIPLGASYKGPRPDDLTLFKETINQYIKTRMESMKGESQKVALEIDSSSDLHYFSEQLLKGEEDALIVIDLINHLQGNEPTKTEAGATYYDLDQQLVVFRKSQRPQ